MRGNLHARPAIGKGRDSLPAPEVIAEEIVEHLSAALAQFEAVAAELRGENGDGTVSEEEGVEQLLPDDR